VILPSKSALLLDRDRKIFWPNHKLSFSAYKTYNTPSGEKIWFPDKAMYTGYSPEGSAPSGGPLETVWKEFHFKEVHFNVDMEDSLFELEIPSDAQINDKLTGIGWIGGEEFDSGLFPLEVRTRRIWLVALLVSFVLILIALVLYYRWHKLPAGN
jgi:hypothetical protein